MQNILGQITLLVDDYDKAISYYTELLKKMEAIASFLRFRMLQMLQGVKSYSIKFYLKPIIYCIFIAKVCRWIFQSNLNLVCFGGYYRIRTCDLYPVKVAL